MKLLEKLVFPAFVLALLALTPDAAQAQSCKRDPSQPKCQTDPGPGPGPEPDPTPVYYNWMHTDVGDAFKGGITGAGSHMITIDSFSGSKYRGNLDGSTRRLTHGDWTYLESHLIAPDATQTRLDHDIDAASSVASAYPGSYGGKTSVNLSFGLIESPRTLKAGYSFGVELWDSIVDEAWAGSAVFAKAAGNTSGGTVDGTFIVASPFPRTVQDSLNILLIGAPGALYVGALDGGTIASYSTIAGGNTAVQDMFLVVEVRDDLTSLAGTSFAAPIVTGYAALINQKHEGYLNGKKNRAALVVDRLLETARTDTISDFNQTCAPRLDDPCSYSSVYGVGEASLANALATDTVPW